MNKEEIQDKVSKSLKIVIDKMINNPDDFFDNDKLQEKYNNVLKENIKLKKRIKELEDGLKAVNDDMCEYAEEKEKLQQRIDKALLYLNNIKCEKKYGDLTVVYNTMAILGGNDEHKN